MDSSTLLVEAFGASLSWFMGRAVASTRRACVSARAGRQFDRVAGLAFERVQDDHVAEIAATDQVWADRVWAERTGIDRDGVATGYGDTPDDVAAVVPESSEALVAYHDAVRNALWSIWEVSIRRNSIGLLTALRPTGVGRCAPDQRDQRQSPARWPSPLSPRHHRAPVLKSVAI